MKALTPRGAGVKKTDAFAPRAPRPNKVCLQL